MRLTPTALTVGSTAVSGLSNVIVQLLVAATSTTDAFAVFSLMSATVLLALGLGRALIAQTDMVRGGRDEGPAAAGAAWIIAAALAVAGGIVAAIGIFVTAGLVVAIGGALAASAVFVLQDLARFRAFRVGRPVLALTSDLTVLVLAVGGLLVARAAGGGGILALWVWAGATAVGLGVIALPLVYRPAWAAGLRWLRDHRDLVVPSSGEFLLQTSLPYLLNWVILGLGGFAALAGYRLLQVVFAAVSNLAQGLENAALPRILAHADAAFARRALRWIRLGVIAAWLLLTVVVVLLPDAAGTAVFGTTWLAASAFVLPAAAHALANALLVPEYSMLRLLGFARFSFAVRVGTVVATIALAAIGGAWLGAVGVAWALAVTAAAAWLVRAVRVRGELGRLIVERAPLPSTARLRGAA